MTAPSVSIVIPTHNRAGLVGRAIESALGQTLVDLEVVVVDDASEDDTGRVVASYRDPRVVYVKRDRSGGAAAARNTGVERARAELVSFLDDDDELLPDFALQMQRAFDGAPSEVGLGWCGTMTVEDGDHGERPVSTGLWQPRFPDRETAYRSFLRSRRIGAGFGITVRREAFRRVGGFEERMRKAEDTEFLCRMVREVDFLVVPEVLVKIHKHPGPNLTTYDGAMASAYEVILEKHESALRADPRLEAALYYKTGWLHYHGGDRRRARAHMRRALRARPVALKVWLTILLHEVFGRAAPALHAWLSGLRRRARGLGAAAPP